MYKINNLNQQSTHNINMHERVYNLSENPLAIRDAM